MSPKKNKFTFESDELRLKYLNEIVSFFQDQRDESIGIIAAEELLEFFLNTMGEEVYRKAIADCKKLIDERTADLQVELDVLGSK